MDVAEYEDRFRHHLRNEKSLPFKPMYGVDNDFSLFRDQYKNWDLNQLSYDDSLIHKVSQFMFLILNFNPMIGRHFFIGNPMIKIQHIEYKLSATQCISKCITHNFIYPTQESDVIINGIQTPYIYVGMANTTFGFHLEDGDLSSISYLHSGKPKIWYIVPGEEANKLTQLVQKLFIDTGCDFYIRHKNVMIPPSVLEQNNIRSRVSVLFNFEIKL